MGQIGFGVAINALFGNDGIAPTPWFGREIASAALVDDTVRLTFADGSRLAVFDDGQSCCESRYITTDDDLESLVGHKLVRIDEKPGPNVESGEPYADEHETAFVEIGTDKGFVTLTTHNEHNGHYGGFSLTVREAPAGEAWPEPRS